MRVSWWSPTACPSTTAPAPDGACEWRRSPGGLVSALHPILRTRRRPGSAGPAAPAPRPPLPDIDGVRMHAVPLSAEDAARTTTRASPTPPSGRSTTTPSSSRSTTAAGGRRTSGSTGASPRRPPRSPSRAPWSGCRTTTCSWCPAMLRELRPDLRIGFFLHMPFPPPELFMQLPRRAELLRGMLGADLVGFQRAAGARTTSPSSRPRCSALPATDRRIEVDGRIVRIGAFPVSIDIAEMEALAGRPDVAARASRLRADLGDPAAGDPRRRPARLHQGHRAAAQGVPRAARRRPGQGARHGAGAGRGAEPGAGRAVPDPAASGSSARSAGSTASSAGSASRRSTTSTSRSTGPSWPRSTGPPTSWR